MRRCRVNFRQTTLAQRLRRTAIVGQGGESVRQELPEEGWTGRCDGASPCGVNRLFAVAISDHLPSRT